MLDSLEETILLIDFEDRKFRITLYSKNRLTLFQRMAPQIWSFAEDAEQKMASVLWNTSKAIGGQTITPRPPHLRVCVPGAPFGSRHPHTYSWE